MDDSTITCCYTNKNGFFASGNIIKIKNEICVKEILSDIIIFTGYSNTLES